MVLGKHCSKQPLSLLQSPIVDNYLFISNVQASKYKHRNLSKKENDSVQYSISVVNSTVSTYLPVDLSLAMHAWIMELAMPN